MDQKYVRISLSEALMELCESVPLMKITVADVAAKVGMARQTFYKHFQDINDLIFFTAARRTVYATVPIFDRTFARENLEWFVRHKAFFKQLASQKGQNNVLDSWIAWQTEEACRLCIPNTLGERDRLYRRALIEIYVIGSYTLLINWFAHGLTTSIDILIDAFFDSAPPFMAASMATYSPDDWHLHEEG